MPRKPGLPKKRSIISLTWQQTLGLIQSIPISTFRFKDDEERRRAWEKNRTAILKLQGKPLDIGKDSADLHQILHRTVWFDYFERPIAFYQYNLGLDGMPKNQREFLIKNGLLNPAEKRLLEAKNTK